MSFGTYKFYRAFLLMAAFLFAPTTFTSEALGLEQQSTRAIGDRHEAKKASKSPLSLNFVTVAIADSLARDEPAIRAALRANPYIRVSTSKADAEYLLAPYPDFPNTLILIDIGFHFPAKDSVDRFDQVDGYIANLYERLILGKLDSPGSVLIAQKPLIVGRVDDGSLAKGLNKEVNTMLWYRRLVAKAEKDQSTDIVTKISSDWVTWTLSVQNLGATRKYVTILRLDNENQTSILWPTDASERARIEPGTMRTRSSDDISDELAPEGSKRYNYITISSKRPIKLTQMDRGIPKIPQHWNIAAQSPDVPTPEVGGGGGTKVPPDKAPWQVQLYSTDISTPGSFKGNTILSEIDWQLFEKTHRCGGSLIAENIVLTAAHCVAGKPFVGSTEAEQSVLKYRRVKVATNDLRAGGTTLAIDSVVVHRDYRPGNKNRNDIALLRIRPDSSTILEHAKLARPIALKSQPTNAGDGVIWYGWGVTEEVSGSNTRLTSANEAQRNPARLRAGQMQILDRDQCKLRPIYSDLVTGFMLCAITPPDSEAAQNSKYVFTCLGDSGGPIVGWENGETVQIGIISWAVGCGANGNPSVSAYVYRYRSWIKIAKTRFVSDLVVRQ